VARVWLIEPVLNTNIYDTQTVQDRWMSSRYIPVYNKIGIWTNYREDKAVRYIIYIYSLLLQEPSLNLCDLKINNNNNRWDNIQKKVDWNKCIWLNEWMNMNESLTISISIAIIGVGANKMKINHCSSNVCSKTVPVWFQWLTFRPAGGSLTTGLLAAMLRLVLMKISGT